MERKYYDYANNHDGFDIYQDFDYHGDERKQTRTRRRKWEKVRRRGKVKSILNYPRKKDEDSSSNYAKNAFLDLKRGKFKKHPNLGTARAPAEFAKPSRRNAPFAA